MTEILISLNKYIWTVDFLALCIFAFIALKRQQVNSSTIALTAAVLLSGIIGNYESLIKALSEPNTVSDMPLSWLLIFLIFNCGLSLLAYFGYKMFKNKSLPWRILYFCIILIMLVTSLLSQFGSLFFDLTAPNYRSWTRVMYYLGLAVLDGLVIYVIFKAHLFFKIAYSFLAKTYLLAFFIAACLQIVRFVERYIWDTYYLQALYQWGLVSVNIATTTVVLIIAFMAVLQLYNSKQRTGALWNL